MPIFARSKNSKKATDQPKETPTGKNTSNPAPVRPNLTRASTDVPHGSVAPPKNTYTPQRPSNLRASSSASIRSLPAMPLMTRSAASEPNLPSRGRPSRTNSDLSIDSVMMSRSQSPSPSGRMVLQTRQADFKPTVYTYDPSKAPALVGRKRPHRSYHSKPPTRASSFVRSPHISTMVEENEEVEEQADSSSSSTKSHESDSSTQSRKIRRIRIPHAIAYHERRICGDGTNRQQPHARTWERSPRTGYPGPQPRQEQHQLSTNVHGEQHRSQG
ncbi:hypothetical protein B0J12DRAFT_284703 [Macrophomina phaseolina]|uniref:Uncharacterized protein n=1 Tax=Macrophomina phaseolina TaxID=35725 RepID=A0ABQ8GN51_9PEZI|nr:hypothetical protein B0J12DRAFT_284703 [Macrophomina phaseolina]